MSRPLRIEYPDAWYHVMNRGRRGESVFRKKEDSGLGEEFVFFGKRLGVGGRATASIRYRNEWRWNGPPKWAHNAFFEGKKAVIARGPSDPNSNEDE
jgi:hypothetical protein